MTPVRIFVGAGEASGDRILAALLGALRAELHAQNRALEVAGFGGPRCEEQGLRSLLPLRDLAVNGLLDVLRRTLFLAPAYARLRRALAAFRPDLVLLVDYPGMNLGLARAALKRGVPVHFVAPPQLWAYRAPQGRLRRLRRDLKSASLQFLFPFEAEAYAPWDGPVSQGHFFPEPAFDPPRGTRLLLCPGSRAGVMARNLPSWLENVRSFFGTLEGVDVLVPDYLREDARRLCGRIAGYGPGGPEILTNADEAFARAGAAIAFPGTVTLELFLRRIPTRAWAIVDPPTLWMGRRKLRGPRLSLPNVLAGVRGKREILPEWVGTVTDFKRNPPGIPDRIGDWSGADPADAVAAVWAAMGSHRGVEQGLRACLEIISSAPESWRMPAG
jgi:lipid-A-disaccharide synthase